MHAELQLQATNEVPAELLRALRGLDAAVWLDPALRELVAIRTAQLDGCGGRVVERARAALDLGETPERLIALTEHERSHEFTAREKAALTLVEALASPDAEKLARVRRDAARHFDPIELAYLAFACASAAAWNRFVLAVGADATECG